MSDAVPDNVVSAAEGNSALPIKPARRDRMKETAVRLAFAVNLTALAGMIGWIASDGQFMQPSTREISPRGLGAGNPFIDAFQVIPMTEGRLRWLWSAGSVAVGTVLIVFFALFFGAARHRQLRSWLILTALVAAWLTLWSTWPELSWAAQRWRTARYVEGLESIAEEFRSEWPTQDGASETIGPFSAYPIGSPQTLMPLTDRSVNGLSLSVVDRSEAGGLRFELGGNEHGVWLEWHRAGQSPESFISGLEVDYRLIRSSPLERGWFLAKYR